MSPTRRTIGVAGLAMALTLFLGAPANAQDVEATAAEEAHEVPDSARLAQFARAHLQINDARDEFHGQIARVHDEEGRLRAREEVDARIAEILEGQEMTQEEYDDFILLISLDGALRSQFDSIVAALAEQPSN
jgi:hypothetical protein